MRQSCGGFTFMELLVVVAIIGAFSAVGGAIIYLSGGNTLSVQKARMAETLLQARNMAMMRGECVVVTVQNDVVSTAAFAADAARSCAGPFVNRLRALADVNFRAAGITLGPLSNGTGQLVFNTFGGLTPDVAVTFSMTDVNGQVAGVRIYPAIGQVRVR